METEIQVYNVDTMGPVMSIYSVKWILQNLADRGVRGVQGTIRMVGELADAARNETPVRLMPSVPGGSVNALTATVSAD